MPNGDEGDRAGAVERVEGLVLTRDPSDPCWELRPKPSASKAAGLIGWVRERPAVDAGVPDNVARLLARLLCRLGKVTFLHLRALALNAAPRWRAVPEGWACTLVPDGWVSRLLAPRWPLICTSEPEVACSLFEAEGFSWELQAQTAVLSPRQDGPPRFAHHHWTALLERSGREGENFGAEVGVSGLLSPAVDGDFAELIAFAPLSWKDVEAKLRDECVRAGLTLEIVHEAAFKSMVTGYLPDRA